MAGRAEPIGNQNQLVPNRGVGPAARQMALAFFLLSVLTAIHVATRQWDPHHHPLQSGKFTLIACGAGLGVGFLTGGVPLIGGDRTSWARKYSQQVEQLNNQGLRVIVQICTMAALSALLGTYPAVGMGFLWFVLGNHLWHRSQEAAPQQAQPAAPV